MQHSRGERLNPTVVWYSLFAIGAAATLLMAVYNTFVGRYEAKENAH